MATSAGTAPESAIVPVESFRTVMLSDVATDNSPSIKSRFGVVAARPIPATQIREFKRLKGFRSSASATATQTESGGERSSNRNPHPDLETKSTRPSTLTHWGASESAIGSCNDELIGDGTSSWPVVVNGISGASKKSKQPSSDFRLNV